MSAGKLTIDFVANTGPLAGGVRRAQNSLSGFKASVTTSLGSLSSLAAQAGATALAFKGLDIATGLVRAGIGTVFGAFLHGVGLAADAEQAQISFETMLHSVDKAKAMLAEIRGFAAETSFESPELIKGARSLLAMGINAKDVVATLRMLGDVASGSGVPIENMSVMYGKMSASGRVMNDDLRQLAENGIPVFEALAKQMNVPTTSIRKLAEQGKISFGYLRNALIDLTSQGGIYENMTARQSQMLAGLWSTLKDNVGLTLMQIGEMASEKMDFKGVVNSLSEAIEAMQGPMLDLLASIGDGFAKMAKDAGGSADLMLIGMKHLAGSLATVADWIETVSDTYAAAQAQALNIASVFSTGTTKHEYALSAQEIEDGIAAHLARGTFAGKSDAFFDKALRDLENKRIERRQKDEADKAAGKGVTEKPKPKGLEKVDLPTGMDGAGNDKANEAKQRAQRLREEIETAKERHDRRQEELAEMWGAGHGQITESEYDRAIALNDKKYADAIGNGSRGGHEYQATGAAVAGSSEAYSAIAKAMNSTRDPTTKAVQDLTKEQSTWNKRFWDDRQKDKENQTRPARMV